MLRWLLIDDLRWNRNSVSIGVYFIKICIRYNKEVIAKKKKKLKWEWDDASFPSIHNHDHHLLLHRHCSSRFVIWMSTKKCVFLIQDIKAVLLSTSYKHKLFNWPRILYFPSANWDQFSGSTRIFRLIFKALQWSSIF